MATIAFETQIEDRIAHSTDAELVAMVHDHPGDYEPWALELGRAELQRRGLSPADVARIREETAAAASEIVPFDWQGVILTYVGGYLLVPLAVVAFPIYFVVARRLEREGNVKTAKWLRFLAKSAIVVYLCLAVFLAISLLDARR